MNKVSVISLNKKFKKFEKGIKSTASKILRILNKNNVSVDFFLINSPKIKNLNKKFRNKNKATSILTFIEPKNFPHPESKLKPLGEIYLNSSIFNFSAKGGSASGGQFSIFNLLVHGILHLLGFTHSQKMEKKEREVIEKLKIKN